MERRAQVRARHLAPAHDELARAESARRSSVVEPLEVALAVRREQDEAVGPDDAAQLVHPFVLDRLRQVRQHRERVREIERVVARTRAAARGRSSRSARTGRFSRHQSIAAPGEVAARRRRTSKRAQWRIDAAAAAAEVEDRRHRLDAGSRALERLADRLAPRAARSRGTTPTSGVPATRTIRCGGGTGSPSTARRLGQRAAAARRARARTCDTSARAGACARASGGARSSRPLARAYTGPDGAGARTSARVRAAARAAAAADRLGRPGRGRGARGRAREALDQARGEAVRARPRDPLHGSDDARGRRHARQGRGALLEGGAPRSDRPAHPVGRGGVRLSESRARRGRAAARQRREGRVGRDRVPVGPVAARRRSSTRCAGSSSRAPTRSTW